MTYQTGEFSVTAGSDSVGTVHITQNGLMLVFDCTCSTVSQDILRLAAVCNGTDVPLGVLIPDSDRLHLKKRFSKNALTSMGYCDTSVFYLITADGHVADYTDQTASDSSQDNDLHPPVSDSQYQLMKPAPAPIDPTPTETDVKTEAEPHRPDLEAPPTAKVVSDADAADMTDEATSAELDGWSPARDPGSLFSDPDLSVLCAEVTEAMMREQDGYVFLAVPLRVDAPFPLMSIFCFGSTGNIGGKTVVIFKLKDGNLTL